LRLGPPRVVVDPDLERRPEPCDSLVERQGVRRGSRGQQVVLHGAFTVPDGSGRSEVMGQTGEHLPGPGLACPLQGGGDAEVKLSATESAQPGVEGAADELVRAAVGYRA